MTSAHESTAELPAPRYGDSRPAPGAPALPKHGAGAFQTFFDLAKRARLAGRLFLDAGALRAQEYERAADRDGAFDQPIGRERIGVELEAVARGFAPAGELVVDDRGRIAVDEQGVELPPDHQRGSLARVDPQREGKLAMEARRSAGARHPRREGVVEICPDRGQHVGVRGIVAIATFQVEEAQER